MSDIKIFVSYYEDTEVFRENNIIKPIQVGRALNDVRLDIQGDDEGDNISIKNNKYCEVTAQYWAWKNAEADYYGFMHGERHFVFRDIPNSMEFDGVVVVPRIDEEYKEKIGLNDEEIHTCVEGYDVILPAVVDVSSFGGISNEVQFSMHEHLHAMDLDLVCRMVLELYPEYENAISEFRTGKYAYWHNMFIMKKELFFEYCQWLFDVLENAEEKIDFTYSTEKEMQTLKFISECLLSIYMIKLMEDRPELKIKHLKTTFVENMNKQQEIFPAFEKNNIAVAVSCNEYYMPILGVMLSTMLENGSSKNNYDILVLCNKSGFKGEGITRNTDMLKKLADGYENASLRFVDISDLLGNKEFFVKGNFTPEAYFRLFLPQILKNYEKVLYLDADMIVCHDVADLYKEDLGGMLLGAVRDPVISGSNKSPAYNRHDYMLKLGVKNIYDYFQSGVMLIDLKKMAKGGLCGEMIEYATTHDCDLVDQDVLNVFCQGRVKFIDNRWNVDVNRIAMQVVPYAPAAMWKQYLENREKAYIYHFAGADKPWKNPLLDKAEIFWNAARKTSWYEIILKELLNAPAFSYRGMETESNLGAEILPIIKAHMELSSLKQSQMTFEEMKDRKNAYQSLVSGKKVIVYGAGYQCRKILLYFDELGLDYPTEIWDRDAKPGQRLFGVPVCKPNFESVRDCDTTFCVIAIENKAVSADVKSSFAQNGFTNVIESYEIMKMLAEELWLKLEEERDAK